MSIKFFVTLSYNGVELPLEICSRDTIYEVKQKIERLENITESIRPEKQELRLGAEKLKDELNVSDCEIHPGDNIRLVQKVAGVIQVFIKNTVTLEDKMVKSIAILIDPSCTVLELKQKYYDKTRSFPVEKQRLLWSRHQLEDERSLSSYKIPNDSNINLVARLPGGL
ncbi:putative ubiquitin [Rhizophagus irregularis]|uniref:Ubiquitin n=3 Tax=Rhizophagus irregularis TaxID=588596 RepID=A0A015IM67_RHIIW|nr:hypothetical protein GLOIN_2v1653383 [Rhizophagus irregularis DAOM 181602=DAOM 197198]EXX55295.1 ubiquitin [Rhizophagus irregularis DAOM 197198w]PKC70325.1 putative ubiquitin [Rhizophagus irregularis]POG66852.1 hypothetical protein GLOIN_2v1653383 [Rhizophagus irregularis DAOM 181602=DAOM 197198]UZO27849.1 hypothetical protein OCT59_020036 [Rhizophagus irregularis]CAB4482549.1 unnamed protein product [Rhizophagus irregularis]|eukprot:XP_025173718.1 hypothetical protein GLOIN_2v1653383 [Rhizophagus irregularis DAOM 181602=DAOM 197198]